MKSLPIIALTATLASAPIGMCKKSHNTFQHISHTKLNPTELNDKILKASIHPKDGTLVLNTKYFTPQLLKPNLLSQMVR